MPHQTITEDTGGAVRDPTQDSRQCVTPHPVQKPHQWLSKVWPLHHRMYEKEGCEICLPHVLQRTSQLVFHSANRTRTYPSSCELTGPNSWMILQFEEKMMFLKAPAESYPDSSKEEYISHADTLTLFGSASTLQLSFPLCKHSPYELLLWQGRLLMKEVHLQLDQGSVQRIRFSASREDKGSITYSTGEVLLEWNDHVNRIQRGKTSVEKLFGGLGQNAKISGKAVEPNE
ncbi:hypothetical protein BCR39DRAFT_506187 [Naematelia encephala]|uniref:Uncharacterized protein n=1 Tax=Naematelia encephala TaxID=71784 RepID=A0A1Y2AYU4_9TREE|nr:hypothetical protein BCR39DRAFT_506187 [Naematelia encephala]